MIERRVALATCREFAELDEDDKLAIPALAERKILAEPAVWDDPAVDWEAYDLVVVRSTWDYIDDRGKYLAWAGSVPRLANTAGILRWNTDKRYLRELAQAGVPVVPSEWLEPGEEVALPGDGEYVIKPSISAGSRDTGRFSHAIRKAPLLAGPDTAVDGLFRAEEITPRQASKAELDAAEAALAAIPAELASEVLYARIDLIPDGDGRPVLLELELTEPSLFLAHDGRAASRFAAAIGTHLDRVLKTR